MSRVERNRITETEYDEYTLGLALFDVLPVLIFLGSGLILYTMYDSKLFLAGVICSFIGGLCKVLWKLVIVLKKRNNAALTFLFHLLLPAGLAIMMLSVVIPTVKQSYNGVELADSIAAKLWQGLTMQPAMWCFIGGFLGMCLMGYLGARMDESVRANWIEELINTLAQGAVLAGVILVYLGSFYTATDTATQSLESTDKVQVGHISSAEAAPREVETEEDLTESGNVIFFDGPGTSSAMVFYPGAKVEVSSYAPLMKALSEKGVDCYLCLMPENIALLDKDLAEDVRKANDYDNWYLGGHSLGGAAAAMLLADGDTASNWDGLILLAAYPTDKISVPVLSVYGSVDGVLDGTRYAAAGADGLWPEDFTEVVIEGGNHAQFGDYGKQKNDGEATVTAAEQQKQTVDAIKEFIENH